MHHLRWINRAAVLAHWWQRNRGSKLLRNQTQPLCWIGSVVTWHEFGGTDGYMVDYARGAGIAEEDHLRSWSFSADLPERWGGPVQAAGAAQPGVHGESKGNNTTTPPALSLSLSAYNRPPAPSACLCAALIRETDAGCCLASLFAQWSMRRFLL